MARWGSPSSHRKRENVPGEIHAGHQEEFLQWKACQTLEWAAKGGDGITIPGSVEEMIGCGTECSDLVSKVRG